MHLLDVGRQRAAGQQPHDDLGALHAAQGGVLGMGHAGEGDRVVLQHLHELGVPRRIVEAAALAVHLVRQAAGGHHRHLQVLRIALDGRADRLAQLVEAGGARHRELQHAALQRDDRHRPAVLVVVEQHRQRREAAVVEAPALEERHVELVGHQRLADVAGQRAVALDRGQLAEAAAFVGDLPLLAHAQHEGRVVVEEERRHVVVVDQEQHVRLLLLQPGLDRLIGFEDRLPDRVFLLLAVQREADGGGVGSGDHAHDTGHGVPPASDVARAAPAALADGLTAPVTRRNRRSP